MCSCLLCYALISGTAHHAVDYNDLFRTHDTWHNCNVQLILLTYFVTCIQLEEQLINVSLSLSHTHILLLMVTLLSLSLSLLDAQSHPSRGACSCKLFHFSLTSLCKLNVSAVVKRRDVYAVPQENSYKHTHTHLRKDVDAMS